METYIIEGPEDFSCEGSVLCLGNFDGLHLGHRALLKRLKEASQGHHFPSLVYTFFPHPVQVLRPHSHFLPLFSKEDLKSQLALEGVDILLMNHFRREVADMEAETFFEKYIWKPLRPQVIVVGHDFCFGKDRKGTESWLRKYLEKEDCVILKVDPIENKDSRVVSSTLIKELILSGEVEAAGQLLGRPFYLRDLIIHGDKRGRTLGFPTANMKISNTVFPGKGVYLTELCRKGKKIPALTNVGERPTFQDKSPGIIVETHILNFSEDIYGEEVEVFFLKKLRGELKFSSIDELKQQIFTDIEKASQYFGQLK